MVLRAGDAAIIDTRVMHCGGGNTSDLDRLLFHFSFETDDAPEPPVGFTYNLVEELREGGAVGRQRLADLQGS